MSAWTQRLSLGGLPGLGVQAEQTTGAAIDTRYVAVIDAGRDDAQPGTIGYYPGAPRTLSLTLTMQL
ncbi:hypothetical protein L0E83_09910 [Marichromatium gracile]|uniref:hypothetical protein n=1 Tax=Marichromatium gracile TaxID=1048 RepID=UPI001F1E8AC7|nr:hypothetical protein [Marichromatium gracile]MCF1183746.1 hypothetical protein [Marichromatium gracile]